MKHLPALITIACAAVLDTAGGLAFAAAEHIPDTSGLYWAIATATTVGYGDVTPHDPAGRRIAVLVMLTVIPLFGATFSLFAAGLTRVHIGRLGTGLHGRLERLEKSHQAIRAHLGVPDG